MFTPDQQKIYDGLKSIGESLANFYADGVRMVDPACTMPSKASLIGHMARELDSGLKGAFASTAIKESIEATLGEKRGHFASILAAVGKSDPKNLLANEWHSIAKNFHGMAHRSKAHSPSKDATEMLELWAKYEKVLLTVIGSFLSITNRLDVLMAQDAPPIDQLLVIKNMVKDTKNAQYFFHNLDKESWLESLNQVGFFAPPAAPLKKENELTPAYWPSTQYLLTISPKVQGKDKAILKEIIETLMAAYVKGEIEFHHYTVTNLTQVMINLDNFSFGADEKKFFQVYSKNEHSQSWTLVHHELSENLVEKMIKSGDKEGLLNLLDYLFGFATYEEQSISIFDGKTGEPYIQRRPYVEKFYLNELSRKYGQQIVQLLGMDALKVVIGKLTDLDKLGVHSITYQGLASIEDSSQTTYSFDWEDSLIYFIRDNTPLLNPGQFDQFIDDLLYSKVEILQRLAVHFIRENFSIFSAKWWSFITSTKEDSGIYIHEPYLLLQQHSAGFTDEEFETNINWIESINPPYTYEWNGQTIDSSAYSIRRWLTALQPASAKCKALLAERNAFYEARNGSKMTDHPEFFSYSTSSIGYTLPMEVDAFIKLSVEEQVAFIGTFKPDHAHDTSEEGLGELIRHAVSTDPGKYLYKLDQFIPLRSIYANYLVDGLAKALQKNTTTNFLSPLDFIEAKFADKSYDEESDEKSYYKKWLGSAVSEFVNTVISKQEDLLLSIDDVERLIDLLLQLIQRPELQDDSNDLRNGYINHVWNSTPGRLYGALMNTLKLWKDQAEKSGEVIKWPDRVKNYFTQKLSSFNNTDKEFSITLGMELPYLVYIDKQWVSEHLSEIFNEQNEQHFDYRIYTLFSRNYTPSVYMYKFFTDNQLITKALNYFQEDSGAIDTVMVYALLEWRFWKGDPNGKSIIAEIFEKRDAGQIRRLIEVAYHQRLEPEKSIYLWKKLLPIFDETLGLADSYSLLVWLFELLYQLDQETFELLSKVIDKMGSSGRDAYSLLRHLYKIADSEIKLAGKLVLQVYKRGLVGSTYEQELETLVTKLYTTGEKELANNICIAVSDSGSLSLKKVYNQNN